jgi:toxin ParE1/3/4
LDIAGRASPKIALDYSSAVIDTCEGLSLFPHRGMPRDDIRPGLRLTHHKGRTVIAYAVDDKKLVVSVLGVFYGGQDHERALTANG